MKIEFRCGRAGRPRLTAQLATRLERVGHRIATRLDDTQSAGRDATAISLLFALERLLYGAVAPAEQDTGRAKAGETDDGECELAVDFDGKALAEPVEVATYVPLYDGNPSEIAAIDALLDGRAPRLTVAIREPGDGGARVIATALPALEERRVVTASLDRVLSRMAMLIAQTIGQRRFGDAAGAKVASACVVEVPRPATLRAARFFVEGFTAKLARRLTRLVSIESHWRIGWRWTQTDEVAAALAWSASPYGFVPDDAQRYFADPFVFWRDGVAHVLCEEFPYATGKGVISAFTIGKDGAVGRPRVVLERPYHLSYPMVFERDGAIFMIPETSANRTIELYRATRFPDVWELETVLVNDVSAADATLLERDGRWWLFAALAEEGASSWDALGLFHAERIVGPWTPHQANPVLIDVASARPAGMMFEHRGALMRPAQDCTGGYGSALTLCRVDRLDPQGYGQILAARLVAQPGWSAEGVHTLNAAGGLEVIDCCGWRSRRPDPGTS